MTFKRGFTQADIIAEDGMRRKGLMHKQTKEESAWVVEYLTKKRKELGLSHDVLSYYAGVSRGAISLIESKKRTPSLITVLKICKALGISLSTILAELEST